MPAQPDHELLFAADCPVCGRRGTVVTPDYCSDGHGDECPDRICLDCGGALTVGTTATDAADSASSRTA
jgi:hypothetical protein